MNKKSLMAIERIISLINELTYLTYNKPAEYFFDSSILIVLIDLINEIDINLNKISLNIKNNYQNIAWDIIKVERYVDEFFGESINLGKVIELSQNKLKNELLCDLKRLLENELPSYYVQLYKKRGVKYE